MQESEITCKPFTLPEWTKDLPDYAKLTSDDIRPIFGYGKKTSVTNQVKKGFIPPPDSKSSYRLNTSYKHKVYWTLGYLRKIQKDFSS